MLHWKWVQFLFIFNQDFQECKRVLVERGTGLLNICFCLLTFPQNIQLCYNYRYLESFFFNRAIVPQESCLSQTENCQTLWLIYQGWSSKYQYLTSTMLRFKHVIASLSYTGIFLLKFWFRVLHSLKIMQIINCLSFLTLDKYGN